MEEPSASCEQYTSLFIERLKPFQILSFTAPANFTVWSERSSAWDIFFFLYLAIATVLFIALGIVSTFLLFKRDCVRLKSKIFFTIYTCIALLGFSRALWLALDPYGLVGFIADTFPGWFVISRLIEALGFPSLDTSFTLMIVALLNISTKPGQPWHYQWRIILPVVISIFTIVFVTEAISLSVPFPGIIAVLACEYLLAVGGFIVCLLFLIAGNRLLRKLHLSERKSIHYTDAPTSPKGDPEGKLTRKYTSNELHRHQAKTKQTKRKIVTITYATAVLSIVYSLVVLGRAILATYVVYGSCFGFQDQRGPSEAWLVLEITQRLIELVLALVLLYSITDLTLVANILCCRCRREIV